MLIVNNGQTAYSDAPTLTKGWRFVRAYTDSPESAKWTVGRLTLDSGAGILLKFAKD